MEKILERVQNTKKVLRKYEIEGTFREFNKHILQLNIEKRIEKYKKMMESPYHYFLGSSSLFYYDMTKIPFSFSNLKDRPCWIHGNLHFESFNFFKDEEGKFIFSINDFQDCAKGSYLFDILRMSVSIALKSETLNYTKKEQKENIKKYLKGYYNQLKKFKKGKANPYFISFTRENTDGPVKKILKQLEESEIGISIPKIDENNDILSISPEEKEIILPVLERFFSLFGDDIEIKEIARKVDKEVTKTSFNSYFIFITHNYKELVLELNEVRTPIPMYFSPTNENFLENYQKQGKRVVEIERALHKNDGTYLSFFTFNGKHFYLRKYCQLQNDIEFNDLKDFQEIVKTMGAVTAKLHSCNAEDYNSAEEIFKVIDDDFDDFCNQIILSAMHLKQQVIEDYPVFCEWVEGKYFDKRRVALDKVVSSVAVIFDKLTDKQNELRNQEKIENNEPRQHETFQETVEQSINEQDVANVTNHETIPLQDDNIVKEENYEEVKLDSRLTDEELQEDGPLLKETSLDVIQEETKEEQVFKEISIDESLETPQDEIREEQMFLNENLEDPVINETSLDENLDVVQDVKKEEPLFNENILDESLEEFQNESKEESVFNEFSLDEILDNQLLQEEPLFKDFSEDEKKVNEVKETPIIEDFSLDDFLDAEMQDETKEGLVFNEFSLDENKNVTSEPVREENLYEVQLEDENANLKDIANIDPSEKLQKLYENLDKTFDSKHGYEEPQDEKDENSNAELAATEVHPLFNFENFKKELKEGENEK